MIKTEKYIVGEEKNEVYRALYEMIPKSDANLHMRLAGGANDVCRDVFFLTYEDGRGLSRIWMGYGRQERAVCNWGAVFTLEEFRGRGYCGRTLDYSFEYIDSMETPPPALFCTAAGMAVVYGKYGFVPALKGATYGPMYRPCGDSPKSFAEFCENYYTKSDELRAIDAHFGWRNEIDCLLKFALLDAGEEFGICEIGSLGELLRLEPHRAKIILTEEDKCVGWSVDGVVQLHPKYRGIEIM